MQTISASASDDDKAFLRAPKTPRYTIGFSVRQEQAILDECHRRGIGFSELVRRIIDGWVERKQAKEEPRA